MVFALCSVEVLEINIDPIKAITTSKSNARGRAKPFSLFLNFLFI